MSLVGPKCIRSKKLEACAITRNEFDKSSEPFAQLLKSFSSEYKNVEYVDLEDFLCTKTECPPIKDRIALYFDDSHVSHTAAKKFSSNFILQMSAVE